MQNIRKFGSASEADAAVIPIPNVILIGDVLHYNYVPSQPVGDAFIRMLKGCYMNTGYNGTELFSRIEAKVRINTLAQSNGSVISSGSAGCYAQPSGDLMWYASASSPMSVSAPYALGSIVTLAWENNKFYVNGVEVGDIILKSGIFNFYWRINAAGDAPTDARYQLDMDLFYVKLWKNGVLSNHYVPSPDNKIVDSVTGNAFTSEGSIAMQYMIE